MDAQYYGQRQLTPYRGMLHVVDVGHALAYTADGDQWRARLRNREGRLWPVGTWVDANLLFNLEGSSALLEAVNARPPLPFPQTDHVELWLLNRLTGRPLALLQTRRSSAGAGAVSDAVWRPFRLDDADFQAECLRALDAARPGRAWPVPHRDVLARQVNEAARPYPMAQWFVRQPDGGGMGLGGLRVPPRLAGRRLAPDAFPELLVDEEWPDAVQRALVREYHDWHAAALLTHVDLTVATRGRLEAAACRRPEKLLEVCRLIPRFVDRARIEIALVQARVMATHATAGA
jgi:hypothetical protein